MKLLLIRLIANLRNIYYYFKGFTMSLFNKPDKNYILFDSYAGLGFNDNPKALFDSLTSSTYKLIWVFKDESLINKFNNEYPQYLAIKYNSFKHYKYLRKSQTWIFNYKTPPYFKKSNETKFLQTWHGIPLKKLGCDIEDKNQRFYRSKQSYQAMAQSYINEGIKADYFIAPSAYAKDKFISSFKLDEAKIIETNYPRNIILDDIKINKIMNDLGLDKHKKIILYAPTWRDDSSSLAGYKNNNFLLDFKYLKDNLSDEYQLLYRPHYLIKESIDLNDFKSFVYDASRYSNINDLFNIADILITDYSSVYFDFSLLNKPIYFYMPDLTNYQDNLRDFYINIDTDLPNDYYLDEKKLVEAIKAKQVNNDKYKNYYLNNKNYPLNIKLIHDKLEL